MEKTMTRWGIGPKFTAVTVSYSMVIFALHVVFYRHVTFVILTESLNMALGIILITFGVPIFLIPAFTIDRYFKKGKLCTTGIYALIRHPIYGAWIVFIVPGIILITGSVAGITIPIFMYCIFRILISDEERYLEKMFGKKYLAYKKKAGALLPKVWRLSE
jgi:protein-S-isoprenylcysteine O-methyltransferase Ste14